MLGPWLDTFVARRHRRPCGHETHLELALETARIQMSDEACSATDSCTAPGNGMIERLWRDRLPMGEQEADGCGPSGAALDV